MNEKWGYKSKNTCIDCGKIILDWSTRCLRCSNLHKLRIDNPNKGMWREKNPHWKGGKYLQDGYMMIYAPASPMAVKRYVSRARLVLSRHLGRSLSSDEIVHHINEDKLDDRVENLELHSRVSHPSCHKRSRK